MRVSSHVRARRLIPQMQLLNTLRVTTALPQLDQRVANTSTLAPTLARRWTSLRWAALLTALTVATLLIHGFHPLAEDGGLYAAGIQWTLERSLFPHFTGFVSEHLRFSLFAPSVAGLVRATHLPLLTVLFLLNLAGIALTLVAGRALLRRVTINQRAQLAGIAFIAAFWTVPVAGTSLLLMDPYVTARSFSTPLSLFATAFALDDWSGNAGALAGCALTLAAAAALHPLMAGYALGLILVIRILRSRRRVLLLSGFAIFTIAAAAILQWRAPVDSAAALLAAKSRYYWFLSQWHWYELLGLARPSPGVRRAAPLEPRRTPRARTQAGIRMHSVRLLRYRSRRHLCARELSRSHHRASAGVACVSADLRCHASAARRLYAADAGEAG